MRRPQAAKAGPYHKWMRLDVLEGYWVRFQNAQRQLVLEFSHIEIIADTVDEVERATLQLYADAKALMTQCKTDRQAATVLIHKTPRPSEVRVSTFGGNYTQWAAWRSEFKAKVLDTLLDASDKITLLWGALTKEAASCAGKAERLDALDRMWFKLDKTYDNKYQQVYGHIAKIVNIAPMVQASADKLRAMIDVVDQHMRMLKRFDIQIDHWSPIICVILLSKLDIDTRNQWESKDSLPSMPDLTALFVYLEQRILAIRNVEQNAKRSQQTAVAGGGSVAKHIKGANESKQRFHPYERKEQSDLSAVSTTQTKKEKSNAPDCPQCGNEVQHFLWRCDAFRALPSKAQFN